MTLPASSQAQLRQYIAQLERLEEERQALATDIRDKIAETKAAGFDPRIIRKVLALRRKSKDERTEEETLIDTYMLALESGRSGDDTPLGNHWREGEEASI